MQVRHTQLQTICSHADILLAFNREDGGEMFKRLTSEARNGVISQNAVLFIITAVITSDSMRVVLMLN
jgi:hypothetical protein